MVPDTGAADTSSYCMTIGTCGCRGMGSGVVTGSEEFYRERYRALIEIKR